MKLSELAKQVGKSGTYVMVLQKKFGLPICRDYPVVDASLKWGRQLLA